MEAIESTMPFVDTHREDDRIVDASTAIKSIVSFLLRSLVVLAAAGFAIADAQVPSAPSAMARGETTGNDRVDATHIVETSAIVDAAAKRMTRISSFPMPGYQWVRGACAALKSDP